MKNFKKQLFQSTKIFFVFILIIFLNFSNIGSGLFLQNAEALDQKIARTIVGSVNSAADVTYNSEQNYNLNSNQAFGPNQNTSNTKQFSLSAEISDELPYFQTQTISASESPTTYKIQNHWDTTISVEVKENDETISVYILAGYPAVSSSTNFSITPNGPTYLVIFPSTLNTFRNWANVTNGFVVTSGVSASQAGSFVHIPDMNFFTTEENGTVAGNYFFQNFFRNTKATSLPENSFNTSSIINVGVSFFHNFNYLGSLTALPANSFNTSNITSVGDSFFNSFNSSGSLTSLPKNSFDISTITSVGTNFFTNFNAVGNLTALPANSFNASSITCAGNYFFSNFNAVGSLTSLPVYSFNISGITSVGTNFFAYFNFSGSLTALPVNSFDISNITSVGDSFFYNFNYSGKITKNPSIGISIKNPSGSIVTFYYPDGSEDIPDGSTFSFYNAELPYFQSETVAPSASATTITINNRWNTTLTIEVQFASSDETLTTYTVNSGGNSTSFIITPDEDVNVIIYPSNVNGFRNWVNSSSGFIIASGASASEFSSFTHIPDMIYFTTNSTGNQAGNYFFQNFFRDTKATFLPEDSFDISRITSVGDYFFSYFNYCGSLTSLPINSFDISTITSVGDYFFSNFNAFYGSLTSLPINSFNTSNITSFGNRFFDFFNYGGSLTALPVNSFDISTITSVGNYFFDCFNRSGKLTALPANSFNTSSITSVGNYFFYYFNHGGSLTALPINSFNSSSITSVGTYFLYGFNLSGSLTALPVNSFNTSHITEFGINFFREFNNGGQITKNTSSGISIKNSSGSYVLFYYPSGSEVINSGSTFSFYNEDPDFYIMSFDSNGGSDVSSITAQRGVAFSQPEEPKKSTYKFIQWVDENTNSYDWSKPANRNITLTAQWERLPYFQTETVPALSAATTITINNRWDSTLTIDVQSASYDETLTTYTVNSGSTSISFVYTPTQSVYVVIYPSNVNGFRNWVNSNSGFITSSGASASEFSSFTLIPEMNYFTTDSEGTIAGDNFFKKFFYQSKATSLPKGSFDISSITSVGINYFQGFNISGSLIALPEHSFNTSNITSVGSYFFAAFNQLGRLTSLPANSFNTYSITSVGSSFFDAFNYSGSLTSLPANSFNTSRIATVGYFFFWGFNYSGQITKNPSCGISIKNPSGSNVTFYYPDGNEDIPSGSIFSFYTEDPFTMFFDSNGGSEVASISASQGVAFTRPVDPEKAGYRFIEWVDETSNSYDWSTPATRNITLTAQWERLPYFQMENVPPSSVPTTITINNRWNSTLTIDIQSVISDETLTTYTVNSGQSSTFFEFTPTQSVNVVIYPSDVDGFRNWVYSRSGFITASGASASEFSSFTHIPDMSYFTIDSNGTEAGDYFFYNFFKDTKATSLPEDSFDISTITSVENSFFTSFNYGGSLTALPANSFNTSNITTVGTSFFNYFNYYGSLTALPANSFNTSNITTVGDSFFSSFNCSGSLFSLPLNSFNTSNLTSVGDYFFSSFNYSGSLTALPVNSFNISTITSVGSYFFSSFNGLGSLTALPVNSFNISSITNVGLDFFAFFNYSGSLTALPANSFNTSNIITAGNYFFYRFNFEGQITKKPSSGISIDNPIAGTYVIFYYPPNNSDYIVGYGGAFNYYNEDPDFFTMSFDSNGGSDVSSISAQRGVAFIKPEDPTKPGYQIIQWLTEDGNPFDWNSTASGDLTLTAEWEFSELANPPYFQSETVELSSTVATITIQNKWDATITAKIKSVSDGSTITSTCIPGSGVDTITFIPTEAVDLTITAADKDGFRNWIDSNSGFVVTSGASESQLGSFVHIPDMRYFTSNSTGTEAGSYFFKNFFRNSKATSLPEGSFNISNITSVGRDFFNAFNAFGSLTALPANSFDISSITNVGDSFFYEFNYSGSLTALPANSFDISRLKNVGNYFFRYFNYLGSLTALPVNSFNTSSIQNVGNYFFEDFNRSGSLTALPVNSFNTSSITSIGSDFFNGFNSVGSLTALPLNSFNTSNIQNPDIVNPGDLFFNRFNDSGQIPKNNSSGISIVNKSRPSIVFYYAPNNSYDIISTLSTFCCYNADPDFYTMSFDSNGGSDVSSITAIRADTFIQPPNPTKLGFRFVDWTYSDHTPYDWNSTASENQTLYATWTLPGSPVITNISPKIVQNGKGTSVIVTGSNLDNPSYSFGISGTRFGNSSLSSSSKTFNKTYPSSSILNRTATSATLKIPSTVGWVGTYTVTLLREPGVSSKTVIYYQLPLGTAKNFSDISKLSSSRQDSVKWLAKTGVTGGCNSAGTKYCPDDPVNRGSMAAFLQLLAGYPSGSSKSSLFADVFAGSSKTVTYVSGSKTTKTKVSALSEKRIAAINWLAQTGITGGSGSAKVNGKVVSTYRPQDAVNRGSMASFMLKFSEDVVKTITSDAQTGFADIKIGSGNFTITYKGSTKGVKVAKLSSTRATAIKWMLTAGITGGSGTDKSGKVTYRPQDAVNRGSMATFMKNLANYLKITS